MNKSSEHYLGDKGKQYFGERFADDFTFGRNYQTHYFAPYCDGDSILLDYGCGDGTMLRKLPAKKKIGVEVNPHCHKKIQELNNGLSCPLNVFDNIESIEDNAAEIVISNHCLEHVQSPYYVLKEIKRVLVPGGIFVMVTPYDDWRQKDQSKWSPGDRQNHLYTWSPVNLGNLLVEVGFDVQEVHMSTSAWSPKIFWIHRYLGNTAFKIACNLLSRLLQRREVFSLCKAPG